MKNRLTVKDFKNKDSFFFYAVSLIACQKVLMKQAAITMVIELIH